MESIKKIENRIWKYRVAKELKQSELAFLIGQKDSAQISRYERGLVIPNFEQLTKLCFGLDTKPEYLYPNMIKKWEEEIEIKKEELRKSKNEENTF